MLNKEELKDRLKAKYHLNQEQIEREKKKQSRSMALSVLSIVAAACLVAGFMTAKSWLKGDVHLDHHHHDYKAAGSEAMESSHMPSLPKMYHHPHFNPFLVPYFTPMKYPGHPPPLVPVHHKHHHLPIPPFPHAPMMKRHDNFQSRTFDTLDGWVGGGLDRTSDFYYILPILLVIGLGSFLIPIISTFFTAMVTSGGVGGCCGRRKRRHDGKSKPLLLEKINEIWETFEESWDNFTSNFNLSNVTSTIQTELHNQGSRMKLEYS